CSSDLEPVWQSGLVMNKSTANDIWLFGAGPFQKGTIYDETRFAGGAIKKKSEEEENVSRVEVDAEALFVGAPEKAKAHGEVIQATAELPVGNIYDPAGPPVLPPPARPIAEAPAPAPEKEDPAT